MIIKSKIINLGKPARAVIAAAALAAVSSASAATVLTTYSPGDLFIGFRQAGNTQTLAANIGSATQFLPTNLGGSLIDTSPFLVQFGVVPGTANSVFNLNEDLEAVFGEEWADNPTNGSGVHWAVAGVTSNTQSNNPIVGFNSRTSFATQGRIDPNTQTTLGGSFSTNNFSSQFSNFVAGLGATSYTNQQSTSNSSEAYIGLASGTDNWNTRLGINGFGTGKNLEQPLSGDYSGPTNSVLDLWLVPSSGSSLTTARTYLGSFSLDELGQLTFTPVPEPSAVLLLGLAAAGYMIRRRTLKRKSFSL